MPFLVVGDSHLGYHQYNLKERERDYLDAFRQSIELAARQRVSFVLHLGDLFHGTRPSNRLLLEVSRVVSDAADRLGDDFALYVLGGNHDTTKYDDSPIEVLSELTGGVVVPIGNQQQPYGYFRVLKKMPVSVFGVNYLNSRELSEKWDRIKEEAEAFAKDSKPKGSGIEMLLVFAAHLPVNTPDVYMGPDALNYKDLPKGFDHYILGHNHSSTFNSPVYLAKGKKGAVWYAGSTETTSISESMRKFVYLYTGQRFEPVELRTRPFLIVDTSEKLESIESLLLQHQTTGKVPVVIADSNLYEEVVARLKVKEFEGRYLALLSRDICTGYDCAVNLESAVLVDSEDDAPIDRLSILRGVLSQYGLSHIADDVAELIFSGSDENSDRDADIASELSKLVDSIVAGESEPDEFVKTTREKLAKFRRS